MIAVFENEGRNLHDWKAAKPYAFMQGNLQVFVSLRLFAVEKLFKVRELHSEKGH